MLYVIDTREVYDVYVDHLYSSPKPAIYADIGNSQYIKWLKASLRLVYIHSSESK